MKKTPIYHRDAEQSVLGSIFLDPKEIVNVLDVLNQNDFYEKQHRLIYLAMIKLFEDDKAIDYTSVSGQLEKENNLQLVGGISYLIELSRAVPSTSNLETYIDLVKDSSLKRQVIEAAEKIISDADRIPDAKEYLEKAEEDIFALANKRKTSEFATISQILEEVREKTEKNRNKKGGITGLRTGFSNLDTLTAGLQREELIILAARPSMGKSAFAMNLALNVAKHNSDGKGHVAIFSLEMSNEQLVGRMLSSESGIENMKIRNGDLNANDWNHLGLTMENLKKLNVIFDDSAAVSMADIRAKCRKISQDGRLDFVVIDYLQLIKGDGRSGNRQEEVARISRSLKQMARELKVPVLALSQLSREVEKSEDKRPTLAHLRESGSIEQDADIVLFLYRKDYYEHSVENKTGDVELIVAKNRQGMSGRSLKYAFATEFSRFTVRDYQDTDRD